MIAFNCGHCGREIKTADNSVGKKGKCPKCGESIQVPASTDCRPIATPPSPPVSASIRQSVDDRLPPPLKPAVSAQLAAEPSHQTKADIDWINARQELVDIGKWKSEFATVRWRTFFPIGTWLEDRPWSLLWVQFLTFVFCFPFALIHYYGDRHAPLAEAAWAFSFYFAIIWAAFLHRCMRPEPLTKKLVVGTWFFTSLLGVIAVFIVTQLATVLPGLRDLVSASESANIVGKLLGYTLAVGLVEEMAKGIPILWFAFRTPNIKRPATTAYIGVISGLAFGATEAIVYSFAYAAGHAASAMSYGDYLVVQVLRFVSLPLLHAIWSGILGYFIGLAMLAVNSRRAIIIAGIALVSVLHGTYNTFSNSWIGLLVAVFSLFIFIGYVRAESILTAAVRESIVESGQETIGAGTDGAD